ncbi:NAD-dependent epimerase/dehydratase family protein [Roseomonas elaeocarpi]|uniref:NAD-dependent epimerase/dehydratase family protein n=1 Tax=Roseomonas elaeocarpi TaxID=907779 RepID=A0ABV6JLL3_9PROT
MSTSQNSGLRVAVTGGGGFIGGRLAALLRHEPGIDEVRVLVRRPSDQRNAVVARLDDAAALRQALEGCHAVFHCAFDFYDMPSNLRIAEAMAEACLKNGMRLVHLSTAAVYEPFRDGELREHEPETQGGSDYKDTKLAIEQALLRRARENGLPLVILQPTVVYGPGGGAWTDAPVQELLTGQVVLPDKGQGYCNAVFVDDVCRAAMAALRTEAATGQRFLISGAGPVTWHDFFAAYEAMLGTRSLRLLSRAELPVPRQPPDRPAAPPRSSALSGVKRFLARRIGAGARTRVNLLLRRLRQLVRGEAVHVPTGHKLALYAARCEVRIDKARDRLGYEPRFDLQAGMAATAPYVRNTYGVRKQASSPELVLPSP